MTHISGAGPVDPGHEPDDSSSSSTPPHPRPSHQAPASGPLSGLAPGMNSNGARKNIRDSRIGDPTSSRYWVVHDDLSITGHSPESKNPEKQDVLFEAGGWTWISLPEGTMLIKPDGSILMGKEGPDGSTEMYDVHGNFQLKIDPLRNPFSDQKKGEDKQDGGT